MSTKSKKVPSRTVAPKVSDRKPSVKTGNKTSAENGSSKGPTEPQSSSSKKLKENTIQKNLDRQVTRGTAKPNESSRKTSTISPQVSTNRISTPQSNRITKTKYFPTKNNYAEVLDHLKKYTEVSSNESPRISNTIESRKNTQEKSVKTTKQRSSETQLTPERPRTSTLRKASIVTKNVAGPEAPTVKPSNSPVETDEVPVEYEDDFESYESDFENCSSSESTSNNISEISSGTSSPSSSKTSEDRPTDAPLSYTSDKELEKKLDSGNFDMKFNSKQGEMAKIQELIEKDAVKTPDNITKSSFTSLSDEGFEESKSLQFLNFTGAKKNYERKKSLELRKRRGEEIMSMIKLDQVSYTIFDLPPVPYDEYIRHFGNLNSIQIGVQTGEEMMDEESQTEEIVKCAKWVQMPPAVSIGESMNVNIFKYELKGVGPDYAEIAVGDGNEFDTLFSESKLEKFINNSGALMLQLLGEKRSISERLTESTGVESFSDGVIEFKPSLDILAKLKISYVTFDPRNSVKFLSVHTDDSGQRSESIILLWNINEDLPTHRLVCYGKVTSCCYGLFACNIFCGLENGSIAVWETNDYHFPNLDADLNDERNSSLISPCCLTDIDSSHSTSITSIQSISESKNHGEFVSDIPEDSEQLISLDTIGELIIWGILIKKKAEIEGNKPHWGKTVLYQQFRITLQDKVPGMGDLSCTDMLITNTIPKNIFVATNYGKILQCSLNIERTHIKLHSSGDVSPIKCLSLCPFSNVYLLAGSENGNISLHSKTNSRVLMVLSNRENNLSDESIERIQWSNERPCRFYTITARNTLDIWDLSMNNVTPLESVPFQDEIICMKLSPDVGLTTEKSFLMLSTNFSIRMHLLNPDNRRKSEEEYEKEVRTFINYVNRL